MTGMAMRYISIQDAAKSRDVSERTIRRWIAIGILAAVRVEPNQPRCVPRSCSALNLAP